MLRQIMIENFHPNDKSMIKIFNLINIKKYYALLDSHDRNMIASRIKNKKGVCQNLNISSNTLDRVLFNKDYWINLKLLKLLVQYTDMNESEIFSKIKIIKTKNSKPVNFENFKMGPELIRVLGHLLGDGGIHIDRISGRLRPFYVNNNDVLLKSFKSDILKLFKDAPIYYRERKDRGNEIWLNTTIGHVLYSLMDYDKNLNKKSVPKIIFKQEEKLICYFLQALYDDEGFIYPKKNMVVIALSKKEIVEDLRELMIKIGINTNKVLIHKSKSRSIMYYFTITHRNNISKFNEKIGFLHPEKKRKLDILINKYR